MGDALPNLNEPSGPFACGDVVDVYDDSERVIARGVIDGEHAPIDGEFFYDVKGDDGRRYDDQSEICLCWRGITG